MEPTDEHDDGTTDSVGGTTMTTLDLEFGNDVVHDQLPTVQEYKANMAAGGSSFDLKDSPLTLEGKEDSESEINVHDQLPSVEEAKASMPSPPRSQGRDYWHYVVIFACLVLVTVAIVVPLAVTQDDQRVSSASIPNSALDTSGEKIGKREAIIQHLVDLKISSQAQLTTSGTPQYMAADWMANRDRFNMPIPTTLNQRSRFIERYILAVVYYATNGPFWTHDMDFLSEVDHCDWNDRFITNSGQFLTLGVSSCEPIAPSAESSGGSMVHHLALPSNNMVGEIPSEIQNLHRLEVIHLAFNPGLTGRLPFGLQKLNRVKDFEVQYCGMTGTIPDRIGNMQALTNLSLGNNNFEGMLPTGLFQLTNLELLGLDDNFFEGDISPFQQLPNLKFLYGEDNEFTGEITSELINNWSSMQELDLSTNRLDSTIPANVFSMPNLSVLDLHDNSLKGIIPENTGVNDKLLFLALHENTLIGPIPTTIGNLKELRHLDVAKNQISLPLPGSIGLLTNLRYLFTGQNAFTDHALPFFLGSLTMLRELSMKNNSLTGAIPPTIGSMFQLQLIDLHQNKLTGQIPEEISRLTSLDLLLLNRNRFSGTLPASFSALTDLDILLLDGNDLNGTADALCGEPLVNLAHFVADCEGPDKEIECTCCDVCCNDNNTTCNNLDWHFNLDPIWEYGFRRNSYKFSQDVVAGP